MYFEHFFFVYNFLGGNFHNKIIFARHIAMLKPSTHQARAQRVHEEKFHQLFISTFNIFIFYLAPKEKLWKSEKSLKLFFCVVELVSFFYSLKNKKKSIEQKSRFLLWLLELCRRENEYWLVLIKFSRIPTTEKPLEM